MTAAPAEMPGRPAHTVTALCPHCTDGECASLCCGGVCRQCDGGGEVCATCGVWPCGCAQCDEDACNAACPRRE